MGDNLLQLQLLDYFPHAVPAAESSTQDILRSLSLCLLIAHSLALCRHTPSFVPLTPPLFQSPVDMLMFTSGRPRWLHLARSMGLRFFSGNPPIGGSPDGEAAFLEELEPISQAVLFLALSLSCMSRLLNNNGGRNGQQEVVVYVHTHAHLKVCLQVQ